jgi:uncharacterized membrane protein (UPF0127 family)
MRILIAIACLTVAACSPQPAAKQGTVRELDGAFEFSTLEIVNDTGERLVFDVYLAQDFEQRRRGLMFVRSMPERTGMLFVYESDEVHSMWMKNTYIPLDMIFARSDGSVSSVIHRAEPHTLVSRASIEPVRYVLELNGGVARRLGIGSRSRIIRDR